MLINKTIVLATSAAAYKTSAQREALQSLVTDEIVEQIQFKLDQLRIESFALEGLQSSSYFSDSYDDYSSSYSSSDDMSSEDYELFFGNFQPKLFDQITK